MRDCYEAGYGNKLDNLGEMDIFLKIYNFQGES